MYCSISDDNDGLLNSKYRLDNMEVFPLFYFGRYFMQSAFLLQTTTKFIKGVVFWVDPMANTSI